MAARVDAQLGREAIVSPRAATLFIEAQITPAEPGPGWNVHISLTTDDASVSGVRNISSAGPDCAEAADSAALAIALMIDPTSGQPRSGAAFADTTLEPELPPPGPHPPSAAPLRGAVEPAPRSAERSTIGAVPAVPAPGAPWRARVSLGALGMLGQLPGAAFGITGGVALGPPRRRAGVEVGGMYLPLQRAELRPNAGGEFSASALAMNGWLSPYRARRLSVTLLAGGQVGRIAAHGFGFNSNRAADSWLLNVTTQAELGWELSQSWQALLRLGLGVPLWKDSFDAGGPSGTTPIFRPSALVGSLSLGIGVAP
jgi:hypothetical protein